MTELKQYIYIDADGIDSLYAQIVNEVVIENEIETGKRSNGSAKGSFSARVNELFNTDVNLIGEREVIHSSRQKTMIPYESKIQLLYDYIIQHENLIDEYSKIKGKYQTKKQNFVLFSSCFDTTLDCQNWENSMYQIGKYGYVPLYKAPSESFDGYDYRDSYYKKSMMYQTKITMNLGIQKMIGYSSYAMTSHLAVLFRSYRGKDIPLGVFGHIYRLAEDLFQIKPYAVWRVS